MAITLPKRLGLIANKQWDCFFQLLSFSYIKTECSTANLSGAITLVLYQLQDLLFESL